MDSNYTILLKRFDKSLPLPKKHTKGSVAYDVYARLNMSIQPGEVAYIPLNVALKVPHGFWVMIIARSSLHKKGLWLANGVGVVDADYCGDGDEYKAAAYNFSNKIVHVKKAERIAQLIIQPVIKTNIEEVSTLGSVNRGGFGTTGRS